MNIKTRRLLAVTVTSALVSAPALVSSGAARADTPPPAGSNARLGLGDLLGGTSTAPLTTNPLGALLNEVIATLGDVTSGSSGTAGGGSTNPVDTLTDTLTGVLTGTSDPQTMLIDLTTQLASQLGGVEGGPELLAALASGDPQETISTVLSVLPLDSIFPSGFSPDLMTLLGQTSNPEPDNTDELVAAMTEYYKKQNMSEDDVTQDATAKGIPASVVAALLAALSKKPATTPKPTPSTGPSAACRNATKKVKRIHKQLRVAKRQHHAAKKKTLAKKLAKARKAKRHAC